MTLVLSNQNYNGTSRIVNLPTPVDPTEPVRLQELNSALAGLSWKDNCRVATDSNVNLSAPGATIDGVSMNLSDRVLLFGQTLPEENGIYIWNGAGVGMTRSLDASTSDGLESAVVQIDEGSSQGVKYRQTSVNFLLGTDPVAWTDFGENSPPASTNTPGLLRIATQAEVDAGVEPEAAVTPETLKNYAQRVRKYASTIGDGSNTTFTINHNFNTRAVQVSVYQASGNYADVIADISRPDANTVQVTFAAAPASGAFNVVVVG